MVATRSSGWALKISCCQSFEHAQKEAMTDSDCQLVAMAFAYCQRVYSFKLPWTKSRRAYALPPASKSTSTFTLKFF